ncbi:hypothetical protein DQ384_02565 [Sphaerisporangium album]|uniref:DUF5753 domain-containing protein n=1 Tax=Sphaerisporangium album TaxID=509200 RepID=A0A367FSB9_9ACTN|nr:hypothetical protein DQ384_02565 [Sphaerisporangium album]
MGGRANLREQLAHLVELAQRPNIEIRILPFVSGAHASHDGSFRIFAMPEPYPQVAYVDTSAGGIYVEAEGLERLTLKFDRIRTDSLDPAQSTDLISAVVDELG